MLDLAAASPAGADLLRRCAPVLRAASLPADPGDDPLALARAGGAALFVNRVAQPLVALATLATHAALREALPPPRAVLGYSLGELSAHACAGGLAPEEAVALAVRRAAAMDAVAPAGAGLVALRGLPLARAEALAAGAGGEVAIVNGPDHVVVGGGAAALAEVESRARAAGATAVRLAVPVPSHTRLLAGAVAPFAEALERSGLRDPEVPVLAGVTGAPVRTRAEAVRTLSAQLARRVEWARALAASAELGCTVFLDLGPGGALARMAAEAVPGVAARAVADFRSIAGVARWVEGALAQS
jgi:[acyl-carrier-protein] S-malonyltransferase